MPEKNNSSQLFPKVGNLTSETKLEIASPIFNRNDVGNLSKLQENLKTNKTIFPPSPESLSSEEKFDYADFKVSNDGSSVKNCEIQNSEARSIVKELGNPFEGPVQKSCFLTEIKASKAFEVVGVRKDEIFRNEDKLKNEVEFQNLNSASDILEPILHDFISTNIEKALSGDFQKNNSNEQTFDREIIHQKASRKQCQTFQNGPVIDKTSSKYIDSSKSNKIRHDLRSTKSFNEIAEKNFTNDNPKKIASTVILPNSSMVKNSYTKSIAVSKNLLTRDFEKRRKILAQNVESDSFEKDSASQDLESLIKTNVFLGSSNSSAKKIILKSTLNSNRDSNTLDRNNFENSDINFAEWRDFECDTVDLKQCLKKITTNSHPLKRKLFKNRMRNKKQQMENVDDIKYYDQKIRHSESQPFLYNELHDQIDNSEIIGSSKKPADEYKSVNDTEYFQIHKHPKQNFNLNVPTQLSPSPIPKSNVRFSGSSSHKQKNSRVRRDLYKWSHENTNQSSFQLLKTEYDTNIGNVAAKLGHKDTSHAKIRGKYRYSLSQKDLESEILFYKETDRAGYSRKDPLNHLSNGKTVFFDSRPRNDMKNNYSFSNDSVLINVKSLKNSVDSIQNYKAHPNSTLDVLSCKKKSQFLGITENVLSEENTSLNSGQKKFRHDSKLDSRKPNIEESDNVRPRNIKDLDQPVAELSLDSGKNSDDFSEIENSNNKLSSSLVQLHKSINRISEKTSHELSRSFCEKEEKSNHKLNQLLTKKINLGKDGSKNLRVLSHNNGDKTDSSHLGNVKFNNPGSMRNQPINSSDDTGNLNIPDSKSPKNLSNACENETIAPLNNSETNQSIKSSTGGNLISSEDTVPTDTQSEYSSNKKSKRARTLISGHNLDALMYFFSKNPFPTGLIRDEIAYSLGIKPRTVQIWFQNQRQKSKTKDKERIGSKGLENSQKSSQPINNTIFGALAEITDSSDSEKANPLDCAYKKINLITNREARAAGSFKPVVKDEYSIDSNSDNVSCEELYTYRSSKNSEFAFLDLLSDAADLVYHESKLADRVNKRSCDG